MYFSSNIKLLRNRKGRTQDDVSTFLSMKRSTLSGYENEVAEPNFETLLVFSKYFHVSIDTLIKIDLSQQSESMLSQIEHGYDVYVSGGKLRVLATTVDGENNENIELVPEKAKAGYKRGFADPEFVAELPVFQLPFLSNDRKYRTFQISGDSMLPIPHGSWITSEFVQNWNYIKDGFACIILTVDEGLVFKVVENRIKKNKTLRLHSLNKIYEPFDIHVNEIREIWKFINYISSELPDPSVPEDQLASTVANLL
ncbi:XRE family transcriptional regulator, partial [Bacteroidota bacterium]